ncbi:Neutral/alkaline non-lysosomal ceramidase [Rosistilla ulvae]|uniref:Neutral/alkaline non-lysosomal ceramidase n=1 Tax=Rosistilla ulvae TaxID=1930277 RepID=A0A517LTT6_9BACT|nr:neutral/alkaline non-lysosomal ceramidase N-terminal domain-containing protein [Rosistilla ulvae]QDS86041.1 Neutral/alkaline non-lysosomal ceramidase [Rosistilla ulvae]
MPLPTKLLRVAAFLFLVTTTCAADDLRVGVADVDITPLESYPMAGYFHERLSTGQRDPLRAKAIVMRDGETACAVAFCDMLGVSRDLYEEVRDQAAKATGIEPGRIVVSATHAHTAPDYFAELYRVQQQPDSEASKKSYAKYLSNQIVAAIVQANAAAVPASISSGQTNQETPVSFNRRFVMRDGSVATWQNHRNPKVVRAAGPIDPEIGLLMFRSAADDQPLGVMSNFALHLDTVGGTQWSADFPFYIEQALRKHLGPQTISLFGAGTCGDINHSNPNQKERNKCDMIGGSLATTIVDALPTLTKIESPRLQVSHAVVQLPLQEVSPLEIERAQQLIPAAEAGEKIAMMDRVAAYRALHLYQLRHGDPVPDITPRRQVHSLRGVGASLPVDVTTIALGDQAAIVFLPGEVFVDIGLAIKRGSPYPTTLVVELANSNETMYIPTRGAFAGGGYEVINSAVAPGSGEMLIESALTQLRELATPGQ